MQAVVYRRYGAPDVLALESVAVPPVGAGEVLVRVQAAAVNPGDLFSVLGRPRVVRTATGLLRPRRPVPGRAFAGTVVAVGGSVTRFAVGDEVYGETPGGAYAEFVAAAEKVVARKPTNTTFEEAAAVPLSGPTALQGLRDKGRVRPDSMVLVNGASGGVGTLAVQIGRALGGEVTAVCSTRNTELMTSLGAHHVIDYTREDFTAGEARYDVVLDLIGNRPLTALRSILTRNGTLVLSSGPPSPTLRRIAKALAMSPFLRQRLVPNIQKVRGEDMETLTGLIEAGEVSPAIDRVFPLSRAADALRHQAGGHARGRTVITVSDPTH